MKTKARWGSKDRIGKNDGVLTLGVPKYFFALSLSNLLYFAFASRVHGGLLPASSD